MEEISRDEFEQLVKDHLENEDECRWCFAVDLERVKGTLIAKYDFPDAMLLHYRCSRCGSEFTHHCHIWSAEQVKEIIFRLHPELGNQVDEDIFNEIIDRVYPGKS